MKKHITFIIIAGIFLLTACGGKLPETKPLRKDIIEMVFASGVLEADDQYSLTAETDGYLVKVDFIEGATVQKGQLLAVIDNHQNEINAKSAGTLHRIARENTLPSAPALLEIKANIGAANTKLQLDRQQAERYKRLFDNNSVSRSEYENAQLTLANSQASLKALEEQYQSQLVSARQEEVTQRSASEVNQVTSSQNQLRALRTGKIFIKEKQLGDYVSKGDVIAIIGNPKLIYAKLNVDETNMSKLKIGQAVQVRLNTDKKKIYPAILRQVLPAFDEASRSFIVKAYFKKRPELQIMGTQLEANINAGLKKNALVIPASYLSYGNKVTLKEGQKVIRVVTGIISTDWVEIVSGLKENESLITTKP
jgi:multidrug efflux pump subunit AcrA (membrane-fusion protein)